MTFLIVLLINIGLAVVGWAIKHFSSKQPKLEAEPWQIAPVASGTPIPVLIGTARVRPIPVCFISDETEDIIGEGGQTLVNPDKVVIGTQHKVTYQGLLCWGILDGFQNLIINDSKLASRMPTRRSWSVSVDGVVSYTDRRPIITDHDTGGFYLYAYGRGKIKFSIYMPDCFTKYDGIGGDFYLYYGTGQTDPDPILEAAKGVGNVPAYRELVYVVFDQFRMGMDPSRPIDLVLTKGACSPFPGLMAARVMDGPDTLAGLGGAQPWSVIDASVPAALYALFVDRQWALGIDPSEIDLGQWQGVEGLTNGGQYATETTGVSIYLTSQKQAAAFKDECLRVLNAALVKHPETNLYQLKLIRNETPDQSAIDALRSFDEDDIRSIKVTVRTWPETYNEVVVEFTNPELLFELDTVVARDDASIAATGGKRSLKVSVPSVTRPELAQRIGIRELRAASPILEKQTLRMTRAAWDLTQGDVFKVTYGPVGYANRVLRCLAVDLGTTRNSDITVEAIDDVFAHEELPVTIETRDPGELTPVAPHEPTFSWTIEYGPTTAMVTVIVIDPDSRLQSISYAVSVGHVELIPADGGYTDLALVQPYRITVERDAVELTWLHLTASFLDRNGDAATWDQVIEVFPTNVATATPGALDGTANPIVWDTQGKAVDAKSVSIDGDRSLLILNAVVGFHGTLTVTSTNAIGNTLTLPPGSIYGDGSSLDVTLNLKDQLTVYYDGTYFWWNLATSASTLPPVPLAASLVATATLTAGMPELAAALTASGSATGDLSI